MVPARLTMPVTTARESTAGNAVIQEQGNSRGNREAAPKRDTFLVTRKILLLKVAGMAT